MRSNFFVSRNTKDKVFLLQKFHMGLTEFVYLSPPPTGKTYIPFSSLLETL